jgi:hypothetical protein
MQHLELVPPFSGTPTHPHVATIAMDPSRIGQFARMTDGQPDVQVLGIDKRDSDCWMVYVGCASRQGADLLESEW